MALSVTYMEVWKWFNYNGTVYNLYGAMFEPFDHPSGSRYEFNAVDTFQSVSLSWFQQWNEVCVCCVILQNSWSTSETANIRFWFEQYDWGWVDKMWPYVYYDTLNAWYEYAYRTRVWIDPDEIRPWIWMYRYYFTVNWETTYKSFTVTSLSFDTTPHQAASLWVEGANLCYVPPCIYSGSSNTWYKHIIQTDSWYNWGNVGTDKAWSIWIPSSQSDHHIYYVNQYWIVNRTKESYARPSYDSQTWNAWYIRMTPSTSSIPEQTGYNYLCYVDGWWYKRRMGVWEVI